MLGQRNLSITVYLVRLGVTPLLAADLAIGNLCEVSIAFAALQPKFGHAAPAARRLSSGPLAKRNSKKAKNETSGKIGFFRK